MTRKMGSMFSKPQSAKDSMNIINLIPAFIEEDSTRCYFNKVPDSLLLEIFSNLGFGDLCRCARVCSRWNRVTKDYSLRKIMDLSNIKLSVEQVMMLIHSHCSPALKDFRIRGYDPTVCTITLHKKAILDLIQKSSNLERLTLMDYFLDSCHIPTPLSIEDMPKNLIHLSLRGSLLFPDYFFGSSPHRYIPNIQCLDVGRVKHLTSNDLGVFSRLSKLRTLFLDDCCRVNNGGIEHLSVLLKQLYVLDLEGTDVSNEGVMMIFENCKSLRELYVGHTSVTDEAFLYLKCTVAPSLHTICVKNTVVSSHVMYYFVSQILTAKKVVLYASWCEIFCRRLETFQSCRLINAPIEEKTSKCDHYKHHLCIKVE